MFQKATSESLSGIKELIEVFDRSYIINLVDRTDRRREVEDEFRAIGLAIPSAQVSFYSAHRFADRGGFKDVGTRGNFDSHRNILRIAIEQKLKNVLIFEDDVAFRDVDNERVRSIISQLSSIDWDIICFGYLLPDNARGSGQLAPWRKDILGMQMYAVNARFFATMLQYMNECEQRPRDHELGGPMTADGAYNHVRYVMPHIKLALALPSLAFQRSSRTDIAPRSLLDEIRVLRPIVRYVRSLKHRMRMARDKRQLRN